MAREPGMFNIDLTGLMDFADDMDNMEKEFKQNLKVAMIEFSLLAEEGSKALTFRDEGTLEMSIHAIRPYWASADVLESGVRTNNQYAMVRHEAPYRPGTHDKYDNGVKFVRYYLNGRGRRTHQKPTWRGLKPGRKYMERAVIAIETDGDQMFQEALNKTYRGP